MKILTILLSFMILSSTIVKADDCMPQYRRVADTRELRNDMALFGSIVGAGLLFAVTGGGGALIIGAMYYANTNKGEKNNKFSPIYRVLKASQDHDYREHQFSKFARNVNRELKKNQEHPVRNEEIANIINDANASQAICPEVVDEANATTIKAVFDPEALKIFVLGKIRGVDQMISPL